MAKALKGILIFLVTLILVGVIGIGVYAALSKDNGGGTDAGNGGTIDTGKDDGKNDGKDTGKDDGKDDGNSQNQNTYNGLFSGNSTNYKLTSDYTFTDADVKATASSSGNITLKYLCSFDLGGHTLNLGGYNFSIITDAAKKTVTFSNGKITNGSLNVSIPNGDIEFKNTDIDKSVSYELEAASDTIKISNAKLLGKCTVNSNTHVSVEYSTVSDLTFTGNGILTAGNSADLGNVTVGDKAKGATVNIAPTASVNKLEVNARATLDVSGEVANISVAKSASGASVNLNEGASVATVIVNAVGIKIDKDDNASVSQLFVAEGIKDDVTVKGIELTTATAEEIEKYLSHTHVLALVSSTEVSCTQNGEIIYKCAGCDAETTKFTPAYGHKYTYSIISVPTATSDGVYKYTCANCNHSYDATISSADAVYYHMDVAMIERDGNKYTTVRLQYVSDDSGEYYLLTKSLLQVNTAETSETVYTVRLACVNGLPEVKPAAAKHCGDWKALSLDYSAEAVAVQYKIVGGIVKATDKGYEAVNGGRSKVREIGAVETNFAGTCYRNVNSGVNSYVSVHDLTATGTAVDASKGCSGGISVTVKCKNCDYINTETQNGHYYLESSKKALVTQCNGENDYFEDAECVVCHYKNVSYSLDYKYHTLSYLKSGESINVADLTANGFDCDGFYYGTYWLRHCAICGINVYEYNYYTHTNAAGCLYHKAVVVDYQGNVDFEGFKYKAERSEEGHRAVFSDHVDYNDLNKAVSDVLAVTKEDALLFTPVSAYSYDYHCQGCNLKYRDYIAMRDAEDSDGYSTRFELTMYYDGGKMSSWSYRYDYSLATAIDRLKNYYGVSLEFELSLDDATIIWDECSYIKNSSGNVYERINLRKERNYYDYTDRSMYDLRLDRNNDYMTLEVYYYGHCRIFATYYDCVNGVWVAANGPYTREVHYEVYVNGENCREDNKSCAYCGVDLGHEHKMDFDGWDYDRHWTSNPLATGSISGLEASVNYDVCYDCHGIIGVTVVLKGNWTLTGDVYIKAEDITFDLNGYTIDLNGHNLVIYSYAGERVVMTDRAYDTASGSSAGSITNGVFVLATDGGDVVVGTIGGDADMVLIDNANRYELYNALVAEGYNFSFVRA